LAAAAVLVVAGPAVAEDGGSSALGAREDAQAAIKALDAGDYDGAQTQLEAATRAVARLKLQKISSEFAAATPSFKPEATRFALAEGARTTLEDFIKAQYVLETTTVAEDGAFVRVRVIDDEAAEKRFMAAAADEASAAAANLERAVMMGEPALKRRGPDGSLVVATMSKEKGALIEVEGDDADAVMAFVNELEAADGSTTPN
ncbi:MAG: hypothetical protein AAGC56_13395, partial [Pseudomonadota bacterium]